ncbi:hypothetical protein GPECTOR_502g467 [Gonium pectorale]|uniref:WW domain-containing protein n=1 Tax=Gonium pectorale TaxID=33097 RepID=A0A150FUW4_GONPE|nr:hypothetical protein GPECTOR_502g467 [Gonium pectorale]|eukprot:KXZ41386.1 hypothetical protein GPECTOR_502g467 [Gonium pectorale]
MARRREVLTLCFLALVASSAILATAAKETKAKKKKTETAFVHEGLHWTVHKSNEGRAFFYNVESGSTQWTDPRIQPLTQSQKTMAVILFITPFLLMIGGGAGYIYWVRTKHPELLKGPKKVKGLKNWERALIPPKINKPRSDRQRSASPPPEEAKKSE